MTMSQLVVGSALGCLLAQALLYSGRSLVTYLQRVRSERARASEAGPRLVGLFVKYAAPLSAAAAVLVLGLWTVSDWWVARSARNAALTGNFDSTPAAPAPAAHDSTDKAVARPVSTEPAAADADASDSNDPYSDPDFRVRHRAHRAGAASLKDALLQKAEAKASADLRRETQQHVQRSQYDCEAAERADHYLKAGLDVWGFAAWQQRYFPMDGYKGATLEQCREIKPLVPGSLDLQSTVAQETHRP